MLEFYYIAIFLSLALLILLVLRIAYSKVSSNKFTRTALGFILGLGIWVSYLFLISNNGFIHSKSLPPRFPIFVFVPIFLLMIFLLYRLRKSDLLEAIPKQWAIYFQSFRIVMEVIIFMTYTAGIIPLQATFQGYNYELFFALTAPIVGYFTFIKPIIPTKIALVWNGIGILFLLIVANIIVSSFYLPELWGSTTSLIDIRFTKLPLLLLPGFMAPVAIFVHLFSIMQLLQKPTQKT